MFKALFGCNGTVPLGDRFCCGNDLLSVLKRSFVLEYRTTERSRHNRTRPNTVTEFLNFNMVFCFFLSGHFSHVNCYNNIYALNLEPWVGAIARIGLILVSYHSYKPPRRVLVGKSGVVSYPGCPRRGSAPLVWRCRVVTARARLRN